MTDLVFWSVVLILLWMIFSCGPLGPPFCV